MYCALCSGADVGSASWMESWNGRVRENVCDVVGDRGNAIVNGRGNVSRRIGMRAYRCVVGSSCWDCSDQPMPAALRVMRVPIALRCAAA